MVVTWSRAAIALLTVSLAMASAAHAQSENESASENAGENAGENASATESATESASASEDESAEPAPREGDGERDGEARARFELAQRLYAEGDFDRAAEEFQRAYDAAPRAQLLYNVYLARRDANHDAQAAEALRRYLEVAEIEPALRRNLEARLVAYDAALAAESGGEGRAEVDDVDAAGDASRDRDTDGGGLGPVPWIVLGVGAATLVASVITGTLALDERSQLEALCPTPRTCTGDWESAQRRGEDLAIATDVLWPIGAVVAGTGIVMVIVDALAGPSEDRPTASLGCGPDGCVATLRGEL